MPDQADLERKEALLVQIHSELEHLHPKRLRRRRAEVEERLDETREHRDHLREREDKLVDLQDESLDDLDGLEELLEGLQDSDPTGDPPERDEKFLIAEIDLVEREIDRRGERLEGTREELEKTGERTQEIADRYQKLDRKTKSHHDRQAKLKKRKDRVRDRIAEIKRELARGDWPDSLNVAELLYHDPPHTHLASPERDKLDAIGRIAVERGLRVGEFPPFDTVECVHVGNSWHYRDSASPEVGRTCADRGDGCAMDLNDADGGSDKEVAFYHELVERY
jgi:hypothetical protein